MIKLRLERSVYFKLSQNCRVYQDGRPSKSADAKSNEVSFPRQKILFAIHWYELSGAELFALYCIKTARSQGHSCYCISTVPSENPERLIFGKHCIEALELNNQSISGGFQEFICSYISTHSIDVIHIHHSALMYKTLPVLRQRFPELLVVDTTHIIEYTNGGFPQLSATYAQYIDKHNVASQGLLLAQREMYKQAFGQDLDIKKFHLTYTSSLTPAHFVEFSKPADLPKVITFYGRFAPQKQPYVFVATLERLFKQNPGLNVEAHLYGTGEMQSALEKTISRSKYSEKFHLLGRCDDKAEVFKHTDILFLSSINEGLSFTSFEALIHDRLVVSSDVGDQGELICKECLIPLSSSFIDAAAQRLAIFLTDEKKYSKALSNSKANLEKLRSREVNDLELDRLYSPVGN